MHDADPVGVVEGLGELGAHGRGLRRRQRTAVAKHGAEVAAADELGRDVRHEHLVSVCTGAYVLAELGLLDGLEATTHFSGYDRLQAAAPTAVVRRDVRVCDNGHIVTGAGVSAGIDLALHMIGRMFGMEEARAVANYMMYRWAPEDEARAEAVAQPRAAS